MLVILLASAYICLSGFFMRLRRFSSGFQLGFSFWWFLVAIRFLAFVVRAAGGPESWRGKKPHALELVQNPPPLAVATIPRACCTTIKVSQLFRSVAIAGINCALPAAEQKV